MSIFKSIKPNTLNVIHRLRLGYSGRCASTFINDGREEAVVVSNDGSIVVCWHPEPAIPYECTRPLPKEAVNESALKFKYDTETKDTFRKLHPYFESKRLEEMTFTTKHQWFDKGEDKYVKLKEKIPRDREYL